MKIQRIQLIKLRLMIILCAVIAFVGLLGASVLSPTAKADDALNHQSQWVLDNAGVLNQQTIDQIDDLNDNQFGQIKGHPRYVVITLNKLPQNEDSIEDYAHDQFNGMGIGRKGWHNGLLFVLMPKQHQYRLEVGTGLQGALPDGAKDKVITGSVTRSLKESDYNSAVSQVSQNIFNQIKANKSEVLNISQATAKASADKAAYDNRFSVKHPHLYDAYDAVFQHGIPNAIFMLFLIFAIIGFPLLLLITMIENYIKNRKLKKDIKTMLKDDHGAATKLRLAGIDEPERYVGYISDRDRKRIYADGTVDTALLVALLIGAYHDYNEGYYNGSGGSNDSGSGFGGSIGGGFGGFGGGDSSGGSFGSGFGGDSSGSDGGGFSGGW